MRIAVLTTHTNDTPLLYEPLRRLGHSLEILTYSTMRPDQLQALPSVVAAVRPDGVLFIGAVEVVNCMPVPPLDVLTKIGAAFPLVHLCCDGADPPWWPQLERYRRSGAFALQVNIDGVKAGPFESYGLTTLTPVNTAAFPAEPMPWSERPTILGMNGGAGYGARMTILEQLLATSTITHRPRDGGSSADYQRFLGSCRCVWNHPMTGSEARQHVKGRVVEASLAGALVFELAGSPTENWFEPGVDYFDYRDAEDVRRGVAWAMANPGKAEAMAQRMRRKVLDRHTHEVFWDQVMAGIAGWMPQQRLPVGEIVEVDYRPALADCRLPTILIATHGSTNVLGYGDGFYTVPQRLGAIDFNIKEHRSKPGVRCFATAADAERAAIG